MNKGNYFQLFLLTSHMYKDNYTQSLLCCTVLLTIDKYITISCVFTDLSVHVQMPCVFFDLSVKLIIACVFLVGKIY